MESISEIHIADSASEERTDALEGAVDVTTGDTVAETTDEAADAAQPEQGAEVDAAAPAEAEPAAEAEVVEAEQAVEAEQRH